MSSDELKPCPLCKQPVVIERAEKNDNDRAPRPHFIYLIECECGLKLEEWSGRWTSGELGDETPEDKAARTRLIQKWNTRTPAPDGVEEALVELREMFPDAERYYFDHSGSWEKERELQSHVEYKFIVAGVGVFKCATLTEAMEQARHWASKEDVEDGK